MLKLTDEDRAAIAAIQARAKSSTHHWWGEEAYLAGMRAGMLRAAKICDIKAQWDYAQKDNMPRIAMGNRCDDCARDIRAAAQE